MFGSITGGGKALAEWNNSSFLVYGMPTSVIEKLAKEIEQEDETIFDKIKRYLRF